MKFIVPLNVGLLASDQCWPHTSGGRLRRAHAIKHVLHHIFGHFVKGNKKKHSQKSLIKFSAILPTYPHANIFALPGDDNM